MATKNTILSINDAKLLEEAVIKFGRIVTFRQISDLLGARYTSKKAIQNRVSFLLKSGWLISIKKGFYVVITDLSSLAFNDISGASIALAINKDSYLSFENALQHHGMFDQMFNTIDSVTFKRARKYEMGDMKIRFFKIRKDLYFGFDRKRSDIGLINVANREKTILDMLYFRLNAYNISLVWEKLKEYKEDFDFSRMKEYTLKFGDGMVRKAGFLLERLGIDCGELYSRIKGKSGYIRMSGQAKAFNAKWRVYFDDKLIV